MRDVWGTPYIYYSPAQHEKEIPYELYSCGRDQKDNLSQGDDIPSWKRTNMSYYLDEEMSLGNSLFDKVGAILIIFIPIIMFISTLLNKIWN